MTTLPRLDVSFSDLGCTEVTDPPPPLGQRRFRCGWYDRLRILHVLATAFGEDEIRGEGSIHDAHGSVIGFESGIITTGRAIDLG